MKPMIKIKRVDDPHFKSDGYRILVERLWPRNTIRELAGIHAWIKVLAPSSALRRWFRYDLVLWPEFTQRYRTELSRNKAVKEFTENYGHLKQITLLYAASDKEHTHASILKEHLENAFENEMEEYKSIYSW